MKKQWINGVNLSKEIETSKTLDIWHVTGVKSMMNEFGKEKFIKLNILNTTFIDNLLKELEI